MAKNKGVWPFSYNQPAPFDLPFKEAIDFFSQKGLQISPNSWADVWGKANVKSFTVARVTAMDVLQQIRDEARAAIENGTTLQEFQKNLVPFLEQKGWWTPEGENQIITLPDGTEQKRLAGYRMALIYNANVQSAYAAGRYKEQTAVAEQRPYWMYKHDHPRFPRKAHEAMDGLVFRYDDPIWQEWYPPNGFG